MLLTETFTYTTVNGKTSSQIASYTTATTAGTTAYTYTYDGNGNILSVSDGVNTTSYVYDSQNQLIRENNQAGGFTHTWVYDNAGNIEFRYEYPYTTGELGAYTKEIAYRYDDESWGDLLTAYDGTAITYDAIGNPDAIGGWAFTWEHGRQLASMTNGTTTWTNTYNADGLRTKRTSGSKTYSYIYTGSTLTQMTVGTDTLYFTYDASGIPLTVTHNGTTYYYATNLQGDIVAILDANGATVVTYTYDAWGNPLSTTGTMAATLGAVNPLRYRGYVYDAETGLYYLQSRYYNPEIGRFINADAFAATGQGMLGNNMFSYCLNSPTNYVDGSGKNSEVLEWWTIGAGWLNFADGPIPAGDIIFWGGMALLYLFTSDDEPVNTPEISYDTGSTGYSSPSPNNDDDDDDFDDDYYDDDNNFGGYERTGKIKGKAPRNNQTQNSQFNDATKGLPKKQQDYIHRKISKKGLDYHEVKDFAESLLR